MLNKCYLYFLSFLIYIFFLLQSNQALSENLKNENYLDFHDKNLTLDELQHLDKYIQSNNQIGHIIWGQLPPGAWELKEKIENKIIENNKKYKFYPSDFIHALLSAHVYKNSQESAPVTFNKDDSENIYNHYLKHWKIHKIYNYPESGGYYAVAYINHYNRQIVLAHRGTILNFNDFISKDSPIKTDISGIVFGDIVEQQAAAYKSTKDAVEISQDLHYNLSITGHSLGAWLAEISLYFCYNDFEFYDSQAVTFDSPGSVIQMDNFQSNIINHENNFDIKNLKIIVYLSAPNLVNSCNKHVGKVYRLFPKSIKPQVTKTISSSLDWFKNIFSSKKEIEKKEKTIEAIWSIFGHNLSSIIATFDPTTGKPAKYHKVLDWPYVKYTSLKKGKTILDNIVPNKLSNIENNTIVILFTLIREIIKGNLDQAQYLHYFKYLENIDSEELAQNSYPIKIVLSNKENFSLNYEGHYRTRPVNPYISALKNNDFNSADWYLNTLKNIDNLGKNLTKKQLLDLKEQYFITHSSKDLISSNSYTIDSLRELMLRLVQVNPDVKEILHDNKISNNFLNKQLQINEKNNILVNYLPEEKNNCFIEQKDVFNSIKRILGQEQMVSIVGFPGCGATINAMEYGHYVKNSGKRIVRWFNASSADKIYIDYNNLSIELGIQTIENINKKLLINLISNKISNSNTELLFIFDNVINYDDIKDYIINLPSQVKIIITSPYKNFQINTNVIKLHPFTQEEASKYIKTCLPNDISFKYEKILIEALTRKYGEILPSKLDQVVSYIKSNEFISIEESINQIINASDQKLTTIILDLLIKSKSEEAWKILQYISYLDSDFIDIKLLEKIFDKDKNELTEPIKTLELLSLIDIIRFDDNRVGIRMRKVIQEEIVDYLTTYSNETHIINPVVIESKLIKIFDELMPKIDKLLTHDWIIQDWKMARMLYSHIVKLINNQQDKNKENIANLYYKLSVYNDFALKRYDYAIEYGELALKIYETLYSKKHRNVAKTLDNLGSIYKNLGNPEKSLLLLSESLKIWQSLYSTPHPELGRTYGALGSSYFKSKNYNNALKYHELALHVWQKLYQKDHPKIALSLSKIGKSYLFLGDFNKALKYQKLALTMREKLYLNRNHHDLATSFKYVGLCYSKLNQYEKSIDYYNKALKIYEEDVNIGNVYIVKIFNNIGEAYQKLGNVSKSSEYFEQASKYKREINQKN